MAKQKDQERAIVALASNHREIFAKEWAPLPEALHGRLDLKAWAMSLATGIKYDEPDPDALAREILMQSFFAETAEEILSEAGVSKMQEIVDDYAGATTGPIRIDSLYVTGSDFGEGAPVYVILGWTDLTTMRAVKATTGAVPIQGQLINMLRVGVWPIDCQIVRVTSTDKGGRHILRLMTVDA